MPYNAPELSMTTRLYGFPPIYTKDLRIIGNTAQIFKKDSVRDRTKVPLFAEQLNKDFVEFKVTRNGVLGTARVIEPWVAHGSNFNSHGSWAATPSYKVYANATIEFTPEPKVKVGMPERQPDSPDTLLQ